MQEFVYQQATEGDYKVTVGSIGYVDGNLLDPFVGNSVGAREVETRPLRHPHLGQFNLLRIEHVGCQNGMPNTLVYGLGQLLVGDGILDLLGKGRDLDAVGQHLGLWQAANQHTVVGVGVANGGVPVGVLGVLENRLLAGANDVHPAG